MAWGAARKRVEKFQDRMNVVVVRSEGYPH